MDKKCTALHKKTAKSKKEYFKQIEESCTKPDDNNRNSTKRKSRLEREKYNDCTKKIHDNLNLQKVQDKYNSECSDWDSKKFSKLFKKKVKCHTKKCSGHFALIREFHRKADEQCEPKASMNSKKTRKLHNRCLDKVEKEVKKNNPSYNEKYKAGLRCELEECAKENLEFDNHMMDYSNPSKEIKALDSS